ncbi:hypothetical protein QYE76_069471 [Lolium multiflorum]|uniref:Uncharacterized protein n=1 Tax=Lolium multiflorum TaxID=4521 RepID=A0AAD8SGD1_LOLMU|nr:hypothetical protein QYE76_069471 [Lolium multiflorum]
MIPLSGRVPEAISWIPRDGIGVGGVSGRFSVSWLSVRGFVTEALSRRKGRFHVGAGIWCCAALHPAAINLQRASPTGSIKPWFLTEGNLPLCASHLPLGVPNGRANHTHQTLRHQRAKKDYTIACLRAKIASLEETVKAQETQLKDLEGKGEDIQGNDEAYLSNDDDFEEDEDLDFHTDVEGYEFMEAGVDDFIPIEVDEEPMDSDEE